MVITVTSSSSFSLALSRLRIIRRNERGSIAVYSVGIIIFIVVLSLVLMFPLGDAIADRRNANTAADSAALAGAGACADRIESVYRKARSLPDMKSFWAQFGKPVSSYCQGVSREAYEYAKNNNATLVSFKTTGSLRYRAAVRLDTYIAGTDQRSSSVATAQLTLSKGVCVKNGSLGVKVSGHCMLSSDDFHAQQTDGHNDKPNPKSEVKPKDLEAEAMVEVRLVA